MERQVREGSGFGELRLPGEEETESRVEAALYVSYADLNEAAQARFCTLGAFAPDAGFRAEAAAGVWDCPVDEAHGQLTIFFERGLLKRLEDERWQQHSLLRAYALALLRRVGEEDGGRERHAAVYLALMRDADDRQQYYIMLPDYPQLRHAFEWATEHNLSLAQALASNTANLQAAFSLVKDNYAWANRLVASARKSDDGQAMGAALGTLGNALSRIATLPGEDRRTRLLEALAAYDDALRFRTPQAAPLDYAMTQNNRANLLQGIATLPSEDRRTRLLEALAAYDDALRYHTPQAAPLAYAMTQNNRANLLSDIATLPDEDRRARLLQALAAYDDTLRFYTPQAAPLDYATTQNNRANLLGAIATLPGEDRRARLLEALRCAYTARSLFEQIGHAPYAQIAANTLRSISEEAGELFAELWAELKVGDPPEWLVAQLWWAGLPQHLRDALSVFTQARQRAEEEESSAEAWQAAAAAGTRLVEHPDASQLPFALDDLRAEVAQCWNQLGTILSDEQKKPEEALAAFEEAVRLRPDFAMYWRNHASTNIDLGNLDAAAASLAHAGELEPDHPRLAELHKELEEVRRKHTGESSPV